MPRPASDFLALGAFAVLTAGFPLIQAASDLVRGGGSVLVDFLRRPPTPESLRALERELDETNAIARWVRPWMQGLRYATLHDAGAQVIAAPDGWFFHAPGVQAFTQRPKPGDHGPEDALGAVVRFHTALAARGIRLLVVPVPNKESVYPDRMAKQADAPKDIADPETRAFLAGCASAGVETVDLFAVYREARRTEGGDLYLAQDTHWSPRGLELASAAVAERLGAAASAEPTGEAVTVVRHGDLVRMLASPWVEARVAPESSNCLRVSADLAADDQRAAVLLLGDSFLRIYDGDEPGQAGFASRLAARLGRPLGRLVSEGGGSTLVRQQLARQRARLESAKVVVWLFVERDLRLGTEGWQDVPLD